MMEKVFEEFVIGEIFNIYSASNSIDKSELIKIDGKTPYITRSNKNNGIDMFVAEQMQKHSLNAGNIITIGLDTQTIFYQPYNFYNGQNIQSLEFEKLNILTANYIIPFLKKQMIRFNWGGNGATLKRLKKSKVLLPITSESTPDYDYMESCIKDLKEKKEQEYFEYISKRFESLKNVQKPISLSKKEWKGFKITEIFNVDKGRYLPSNDITKGNIPYITARAEDNGLSGFIGNKVLFNKNSITIEKVKLSAFYQPKAFYCSHDVSVLTNEYLNQFNSLFVCTQINRQGFKYSYGRQAQLNVVKKQKLLLPTNSQNEPDYEYMEQYMKYLEYQKLSAYLKFKK